MSCSHPRFTNSNASRPVLVVSPDEDDHRVVEAILKSPKWQVFWAGTLREGISQAATKTFAIAVCEPNLPDGSWFDFLERLSKLARPPRVVVASRLADDYLWAEVLNVGGFDVLPKPFEPAELSHAVRAAWEDWSGERGTSSEVTASAGQSHKAGSQALSHLGGGSLQVSTAQAARRS